MAGAAVCVSCGLIASGGAVSSRQESSRTRRRITMDSGVAAPWPWPGGIKHRRRPGSPSVLLGGPDVLPLADLRLALVDVVHRRIGAVAGGSRWIAASRPHGPGVRYRIPPISGAPSAPISGLDVPVTVIPSVRLCWHRIQADRGHHERASIDGVATLHQTAGPRLDLYAMVE